MNVSSPRLEEENTKVPRQSEMTIPLEEGQGHPSLAIFARKLIWEATRKEGSTGSLGNQSNLDSYLFDQMSQGR